MTSGPTMEHGPQADRDRLHAAVLEMLERAPEIVELLHRAPELSGATARELRAHAAWCRRARVHDAEREAAECDVLADAMDGVRADRLADLHGKLVEARRRRAAWCTTSFDA